MVGYKTSPGGKPGEKGGRKEEERDRSLIKKELAVTYSSAA